MSTAARARSASGPAGPGRAPAPRRAPAPSLRAVTARTSSWSVLALGAVSLLLIFGAFAGTVALRVVLAEQQNHIDGVNDAIDEAAEAGAELRVQAARLEAPDRIRVAARRLDLVAPPEVVYLAPVLPGNAATVLDPPVGDPFAPTGPVTPDGEPVDGAER